jgi:hypothetical protein
MATGDIDDDVTVLEPGRRYRRGTGLRHVFQLPPDWMTVCYLIESKGQIATGYPKYVLQSTDGAYEKELTPKDDLVSGDELLELRFEGLLPGKTYTLRRAYDEHVSEVVFERLDYSVIVDQPRDFHAHLEDQAYAGLHEGVESGEWDDPWAEYTPKESRA